MLARSRTSAEWVSPLVAMLLGLVMTLAFTVFAPASQAQAAVGETKPYLTLTPAHGIAGTPVTATGGGFTSDVGACWFATLTWVEGGRQLASGIGVSGSGALERTDIRIPPDASAGTQTIRAACVVKSIGLGTPNVVLAVVSTLSAEAKFTVVPDPHKQPEQSPVIVLDRVSGPPGTAVGVSGTGFVCTVGRTADVYLDQTHYSELDVKSDGSFSTQVRVPKSASPGDHLIRVECTGSTGEGDSRTFTVRATGGSGTSISPGAQNPGGVNPGGGNPGGGGGGEGPNLGEDGDGGASQPAGWVTGSAVGGGLLVAIGAAFLILRLRRPHWVRAHVRATLRTDGPGQVNLAEAPDSEQRPRRLWLEARPDAGFQSIEEAQQ